MDGIMAICQKMSSESISETARFDPKICDFGILSPLVIPQKRLERNVLVTISAILVTNIDYLFTIASDTNIQKMTNIEIQLPTSTKFKSPTSRCHQHDCHAPQKSKRTYQQPDNLKHVIKSNPFRKLTCCNGPSRERNTK